MAALKVPWTGHPTIYRGQPMGSELDMRIGWVGVGVGSQDNPRARVTRKLRLYGLEWDW